MLAKVDVNGVLLCLSCALRVAFLYLDKFVLCEWCALKGIVMCKWYAQFYDMYVLR